MFFKKYLCKPKLTKLKTHYTILLTGLLTCSLGMTPLVTYAAGSEYPALIYHVHTGDSQNGGGCYTKEVFHEHIDSCYNTYECSWHFSNHYNKWDFINDYTLVFVSDCGQTHEQQGDLGDPCSTPNHGTHNDLICTHTGEIDHYDLDCGYNTTTPVGLLNVIKSSDDWCQELQLYIGHNGPSVTSSSPYSVNGEATSGTYTINSNGTYTIHMETDANSFVPDISVPVSNIDNTAPTLAYMVDNTEWTRNDIHAIITATDLQPDGSCGCGNITYSYDDGITWHDYNNYTYTTNGNHTVYVRDQLGNTSQCSINIENIDREAPNVIVNYDKTPNIATVEISLVADDIGCGLPNEAYSFDGGKTWSDKSTKEIKENGLVEIVVRDNLDNTTKENIQISNIDSYAPQFNVLITPNEWTNQEVEVVIEANDINPDGSNGCGIADQGYSFDGGQSWSSQSSMIISDNSTLNILVRDKNDNSSCETHEIGNIDKVAPEVSLSYTLSEDRHEATLVVSATDSASGLTDTPYKWDAGNYSDVHTCTVNENDHYTVSVRDRAGNIAVKGIDIEDIEIPLPPVPAPDPIPEPEPAPEPDVDPIIDNLPQESPFPVVDPVITDSPITPDTPEPEIDPSPVINPIPKITPVPDPVPSKPSTPGKPVKDPEIVDAEPTPVITPVVIERTIEEQPISSPKIMDTSNLPPIEEDNSSTFLSVLLVILLGLLLGALILGLLFALSRMIIVYCRLGNKKTKFVGIAFAHKHKDAFETNISQSVIDACDSNNLELRFTMAFIYLHSEEDVSIYLPDKQSFIVRPDTKVSISFN